MPLLGGPSDLSAKRTSENLNTLRFGVLLHRGLFYERLMSKSWEITAHLLWKVDGHTDNSKGG